MDEPRSDWLVHEQFRVVRVSSLPYFHGPFKCAHRALFETRDSDERDEAGRRFHARLTDEHFAKCEYHQRADWRTVARTSVRLFRAFKDKPRSEFDDAVLNIALPKRDRWELYFLIHDPIVWGGRSHRVTNGQHRICAIRTSGAGLCLIDHNKLDLYPES